MVYASRQRHTAGFLSCEQLEARLCLSSVSFASHDIITGDTGSRTNAVYAADVDVLAAFPGDDKIAPYENTGRVFSMGCPIETKAKSSAPYMKAIQPRSCLDEYPPVSIGYDTSSGEVWVDVLDGVELTSINIDSAGGIFVNHENAENLGGSFDNHSVGNIFKATFGGSFGSVSLGKIAQPGRPLELVAQDLAVVGSLAGGGDLGAVGFMPEYLVDYVRVLSPIPDLHVNEGIDEVFIESDWMSGFWAFRERPGVHEVSANVKLDSVFRDYCPLTKYTFTNSNPDLVKVDISRSSLNLTLIPGATGTASISIRGASGASWDEDTFQVTVHPRELAPGDADEDWNFDQLDLDLVIQGGKFLSAEPATWDEGDWNGDGVFDQLDIVASLQTGNYLQGPYADDAGSFASHVIIETEAEEPDSVYAADLDGDGDLDVLSASMSDNKIAWYENTDGKGEFGRQQVFTRLAFEAMSVFAADLDGDGDADVLSASTSDNKIAWYENTDGKGSFGEQRLITTRAYGAASVYAVDLDGDGDVDVLSASSDDDKIAWYENTDGRGRFGEQQVITAQTDGARSVFAADLDGDGDADVLSASWRDDKIAWYENTDGNGNFGQHRIITESASGASSVLAGDVDGDGDLDVFSASTSDNKIAWYENTDGKGSFGEQRVITTQAEVARSVFAADLDGDGDADVLSASWRDDKIAWYENTDGNGSFGEQRVITAQTDGAWSVFAADVDGDGDADVLSGSLLDDKVAWYENTDGNGSFGEQRAISMVSEDLARSVYAADIDSDGDLDVLSASSNNNKISWYENTDGKGRFGEQRVITTQAEVARSVFAADLDGDGDVDVLSASSDDDKIAWYENTDGKGSFGEQRVITAQTDGARSVFAADLDGDGDADVLSASWRDDKIAWYENTDGNGNFGQHRIITRASNPTVYAVDVDNDGDVDVFSGSWDGIAWYENTDGKGSFGRQLVITTFADQASFVFATDLDGDGDVDVLSASAGWDRSRIAWYENTDGKGSFGEQRVITTDTHNLSSVYAADMDRDGDADVLSASSFDDTIAWYENTDGKGSFGPQQIITAWADGAQSVFAADFDRDGDVDVASASEYDNKIAWYENLSPQHISGDANRDGEFNQLDNVQALQSAKYLTGELATWEQGDWNGDGVFDQLDMVAALQTGNRAARFGRHGDPQNI